MSVECPVWRMVANHVMNVLHILIGACVGHIIDAKVVGPITKHERNNPWLAWSKFCLQVMLFGLTMHYMRLMFLRFELVDKTVGTFEGGFARGLGMIWAHSNLYERLRMVMSW